MPGGNQPRQHTVYVGAGSNIGDKLFNCKHGIDMLAKSGGAAVTGRSRFYKTEPVDFLAQDWFVNCALKIETSLGPFELLAELKAIERRVGRIDDAVRFGPRILDMDILLIDDLVINSPELVVPHPRMHQRRFVLQPMCDIGATIMHPVLMTNMQDLLEMLDAAKQGVVEYTCDC